MHRSHAHSIGYSAVDCGRQVPHLVLPTGFAIAMPIEIRNCPECGEPNELEVPAHPESWSGKNYRVGNCSACGVGLFFVPGHNQMLWDLGYSGK